MNDLLFGGAGIDNLIGDAGNDLLMGGEDNDYLTGNSGSDIFALENLSGSDTIADFEVGVDKLGLSGSLSFTNLLIIADGSNTLIENGANCQVLLVPLETLPATALLYLKNLCQQVTEY